MQEGAGLWSNTDDLEAVNGLLYLNSPSSTVLSGPSETPLELPLSFNHCIRNPQTFSAPNRWKTLRPPSRSRNRPNDQDTPADRVPHSNFYFPQEDLLAKWSAENSTHWTVSRPAFIIGASENAQINVAYALALYASIQKELSRPLAFPADVAAWDTSKDLTTAKLIGYFNEWAVLTEGAADQALNIVDDSPFAWCKFWPEIAQWYGLRYGIPDADEAKYSVVTLPRNPPPRGFGGPGKVLVAFSFEA